MFKDVDCDPYAAEQSDGNLYHVFQIHFKAFVSAEQDDKDCHSYENPYCNENLKDPICQLSVHTVQYMLLCYWLKYYCS